jgi:energy-coupling factor transporter ATP-binding protein EcfA2
MQKAQTAKSTRKAAAEPDWIEIRGAAEHNLKIDHLRVPKRELVVFTGVSGSGKSSLAFDTLYAEGQRRYIESLSSYARQFLGQLERPKVEHLSGLSPTIAIEQKAASSNPRSTVGTITEIYDYLRVLFARIGVQHCHVCGKPVASQSAEQIVGELLALPEGSKATLLAPMVVHRKGEFRELFEELRGRGFVRVRVDGELHRLEEPPKLDKKFKHSIELVVDRITVRKQDRMRITESVELALREGKGELKVDLAGPLVLRPGVPRAEPAELLVQLAAGHVPGLQWARHAHGGRSRSRRRRSNPLDPRRRDRAVVERDRSRVRLDLAHHRGRRRHLRHRSRQALEAARQEEARPGHVRLAGQAHPREVGQRRERAR